MDVEEDVQAAIDRLWKNGLPHPPEQLRGIHVANQASAQRLLDENQQLIFAVSENARIKRFADCAAYLERLQQNLLYLALLADQDPTSGDLAESIVDSQRSGQKTVPPREGNVQKANSVGSGSVRTAGMSHEAGAARHAITAASYTAPGGVAGIPPHLPSSTLTNISDTWTETEIARLGEALKQFGVHDLERISAAIGTGRTAEQVRVFMQREAQRVHARGIPFSISGITLPPPPPAPVAAPPPPSAPGVARAGPPPLAAAQVQARPPSAAAAPSMRSPPAPPTLQPKHFQFRPPPGSLIPAPAPTGQQVSSSFQGTMLAPKASAPPGSPSPRPVGSPTGSVLAAQQNTVPVGGPKNAGPPAVAKASPPPPPKG